jgi:hypothetical protein
MCQPMACSALVATATLLMEEGIAVVNCQTGFHRAESCGAVVAASLSNSGVYTVLHLSLCRDKTSDLHHSVKVALAWMRSPWSTAGMQQAWFGLQQACLTRPEAWAAWWEFQNWVGTAVVPVVDDSCVDLTPHDSTSSSSVVLATSAKAVPRPPAAKPRPTSPRSPPRKQPRKTQPFIPKAPMTPPTDVQREQQGGGDAFPMPSSSGGSDRGWDDRGWEEPADRDYEEDQDRGSDVVETSMPRAWHVVLRNFHVDAAAVMQLELLHASGDRGLDAASEIVWKLSKERPGGDRILNGSGFVSRCVTTARKDLHGATRGTWKW